MAKTVVEALGHLPDEITLSQIVVAAQGQRKDFIHNMDTVEGRSAFWAGLSQENVTPLNPYDESIIVCPVYSPHTNGRVTSAEPGLDFANHKDTPAHYNVWSKNLTADMTPLGLNKQTVHSLARGVSSVYWHLFRNTRIHPVIFQLFGYNPKDNQVGLSPGPPSDPFNHLHVAYPPVPSSNNRVEPSPAQTLKFYSPISLLFEDLFTPISAHILENIKSSGKIEVRSSSEPNNPCAVGISFEIAGTTKLEEYLDISYQLIGSLNRGYQVLLHNHELLWCTDETLHPQIIETTISSLEELGIPRDLAENLIDRTNIFKPTLQQVNSWLENKSLSADSSARLTKLKTKYEHTKVRIKKLAETQSGDARRDVLLKLLNDQLLTPGEGNPVATLPSNIPLKMFCQTYSHSGKLIIPNMNISLLLISNGNTAEVMGNTLITRR